MMTAMTNNNAVFLDTNVLIHANVVGSPLRSDAQKAIETYDQAGIEIWISRQILREYLAALTRPQIYVNPISITKLVTDIVRFESEFQIAEDNADVTQRLIALLRQIDVGGKQIHDANIVATMQVHGITRLITHNIKHFDRFSHIINIVPL